MSLKGLRIAFASETEEGRKLNLGKVKWLVGGDTLVGRPMYGKNQIRFEPTHTLLLQTNNKPHASSDDYAFWQRVILIPFTLSFVDKPVDENEQDVDKELLDKLKKEAEAILAWLVRGCLEYQLKGLKPPSEVFEATQEYRDDEDILGHFIDECCEIDDAVEITASGLYKAYTEWCDKNGHHSLNQTNFGRKMGIRFKKDKKSRPVKYLGVCTH